ADREETDVRRQNERLREANVDGPEPRSVAAELRADDALHRTRHRTEALQDHVSEPCEARERRQPMDGIEVAGEQREIETVIRAPKFKLRQSGNGNGASARTTSGKLQCGNKCGGSIPRHDAGSPPLARTKSTTRLSAIGATVLSISGPGVDGRGRSVPLTDCQTPLRTASPREAMTARCLNRWSGETFTPPAR